MWKYSWEDNFEKVHHELFPEKFRMLIVGPSGSGKTTLLMRLLLEEGLLNYDKLYIFARSLYQKEYEVLIEGFKNGLTKENILKLLNTSEKIKEKYKETGVKVSIEEIAKALAQYQKDNEIESNLEAEFYNGPDNIPDPADINRDIRNLIIFDDIMTDKKQTKAEDYYTRGRSANCDCIYLSQNYTHLPLHTIRSNSNFQVFFISSGKVIKQLYETFDPPDIVYEEFKKLCLSCWRKKFGILVVDLSRDVFDSNRYRKQLELV